MQVKNLYHYHRENGGLTVSPNIPDDVSDYEIGSYRLIADEGKILTNGETTAQCIDVTSTDGWTEIDAPPEEEVIVNADEVVDGEIIDETTVTDATPDTPDVASETVADAPPIIE